MRWAIFSLCLVTTPALGQSLIVEPNPEFARPTRAETGTGAVVRVLDRVSGELSDLDLSNGQSGTYGRIEIALTECRYPADNPASDAFAFLTIRYAGTDAPLFEGWMIASSPALSALDHPRYDVWVLRCKRE